jgi:HlyD family secretion protein
MRKWVVILAGLSIASCEQQREAVAPLYDTAPVEVRDIEITVEAAGVVEPETTVEVKSKASGEILAVHAETGDVVEIETLLVEVDKRTARNRLAETEAALEAARARRNIAATQMQRAETLYESGTLTQSDFEQTQLEFANAEAQVVSSQVAVENARISMEDTDVRAPTTGTIIEKTVEPGMVISSPTQDVSGGSVLMKMADLTRVQVRTLVDETDIGKIRSGMPTTVTVAAYPNQPFHGEVLKIEPQAIVEQNVTRFAVLILLENREGLLMPGMNAEVEIEIAGTQSVSAIPTAALRADEDIPATAVMLGVSEAELIALLDDRAVDADAAPVEYNGSAGSSISIGGRTLELPAGVDADRVREIMAKRQRGEPLSAPDREFLQPIMRQLFAEGGGPGGGQRFGGRGGGEGFDPGSFRGGGFPGGFGGDGRPQARESVTQYQFGGDYWVVAVRNGETVPLRVRTGFTDLAYTEIRSGLEPDDEVLLLPSSSLFEQQARLQQMISERFSSTPFQQNQRRGGRGNRWFWR